MGQSALWAVTSYFNPMRYRRRRENFHIFRRQLGIPLLAVELSFDGSFELDQGDADILVRLEGGDVMWQKERLLEIGVRRLPVECNRVACLDCDIQFGRADWSARACKLLERYPMVQPFSRVNYLRRDWSPGEDLHAGTEFTMPSVAFAASTEGNLAFLEDPGLHGRGTASNGFAWVFRRALIERHGMYTACIIGGGDAALVCAAWGDPEIVVRRHTMNEHQERCYRDWAQAFNAAVQGRVGYVDEEVFHLWHGSLGDRQARERHLALRQFEFDPLKDLALDASGCWRWNSDKPRLHAYLRDYFAARREDG